MIISIHVLNKTVRKLERGRNLFSLIKNIYHIFYMGDIPKNINMCDPKCPLSILGVAP